MVISESRYINGVLLIYHHRPSPDAAALMENVDSFRQYSRFRVWNVNTFWGFPKVLKKLRFKTILLHYSLFGGGDYCLDAGFLDFLEESGASYKIAFFQDEMQFCQKRVAFLNKHKIDCIYTLVDPENFEEVYWSRTRVSKIINYIPGYVSDGLIAAARRMSLPDEKRQVDISYRGRKLPLFLGQGAREKYEIAVTFKERARGLGLKLDVETNEQGRLYGDDWYRFLASSRACLGTEAGGSIFDLDGEVYREYCRAMLGEEVETAGDAWYAQYTRLLAKEMTPSGEEEGARLLKKWEGNLPNRVISPRHFEAAAFRVCQIMFEGRYSGIMQPMVHFIPLKKDFSNFDEVIRIFKNEEQRREITENAHRDMIASGKYNYQNFIRQFDEELSAVGLKPTLGLAEAARVSALLYWESSYLKTRHRVALAGPKAFPGRAVTARIAKSLLKTYRGDEAKGI